MEVDEVEANTDGRNHVEEIVFAEKLPTEHPVCTVREPFNVVQALNVCLGRCIGVLAFDGSRVGVRLAFRNLVGHEVDVEPSQELLVLGADNEVQAEVVVVKLVVVVISVILGKDGIGFAGGVRSYSLGHVAVICKGNVIDVLLEFAAHATEVCTNGNKTADVFLVVETGFGGM